jgi:hypothetical protein
MASDGTIELPPDFADALRAAVVIPEDKPLDAALSVDSLTALSRAFSQLCEGDEGAPLALLVVSCELAAKGMSKLAQQCRTMVKAALDATQYEHMLARAGAVHEQKVAETKKAAIDMPRVSPSFSMRAQPKRGKP